MVLTTGPEPRSDDIGWGDLMRGDAAGIGLRNCCGLCSGDNAGRGSAAAELLPPPFAPPGARAVLGSQLALSSTLCAKRSKLVVVTMPPPSSLVTSCRKCAACTRVMLSCSARNCASK